MFLWRKKSSYRPFYKRKRFYLLLLLGFGLFKFYQLAEFRLDDGSLIARLRNNPASLNAEIGRFKTEGRSIRYVEIGRDSLPLIVFIHGAPSSSTFWLGMLTDSNLLQRAKLMAVDRPGYGFSGFGMPEQSVEKQAAAIAELLKIKKDQHPSLILHGSSYGGTVAARIAMDYPDLIDGLLLQSASLAPGEEKIFWITYPTSHWSLSWLLPPTLAVANAEKLSHREQLEAMVPLWSKIKAATILMQGSDDWLIYPSNSYFACDQLINAQHLEMHMAPNRGHDLLWTQRDWLVRGLQKLIRTTTEIKNKVIAR